MEALLRSLTYALRSLLKNPAFTVVAVLTLALGIGANTALFSAVHAVVLRPLGYEQEDRLMMLWRSDPGQGIEEDLTSYPNFVDWRQEREVFEDMAAFFFTDYNLTGDGEARRVQGCMVSPGFFEVLGVRPLLGRAFRPEEGEPGRDGVVILSHDLWQQRYGAADILGRDVLIDNQTRAVVGVLPPDFDFSPETAFWLPLAPDPNYRAARGAFWLRVVGRLAPGVAVGRARAHMDTVARRLAREYPATNEGSGIRVVPLREQVVSDVRGTLLALFGAVTFVLLIACGNVANLQLARAAAREQEMALRAAVGASRWRLALQRLAESLCLALLGAAAGLWLAKVGLGALIALGPRDIPRLDEVSIDSTVLAYTAAVAVLTGLLFGLVPALQLSGLDLTRLIKEGDRRGIGLSRGGGLRRPLVIGEIALALVLLIGAGLLTTNLRRLQQLDPGFNPEGVLTVRLGLSPEAYPEEHQVLDFYWRALEQVRTLPEVESAGATSEMVLEEYAMSSALAIEGRTLGEAEQRVEVARVAITPDLLRTLEVPLLAGRPIGERDSRNAPPVALVNAAVARRFWPGEPLEEVVGQRIKYGSAYGRAPWITIVGVVGDTQRPGLDRSPRLTTYRPHEQMPASAMTLMIRSTGDPLRLASAARAELALVDDQQPVAEVATLEQLLAEPLAQRRFSMLLLSIFSTVALVLALVGIYGVLSYLVRQSTHEIGIRMALGAGSGDLLALVLRQGLRLALWGLALGMVAALMLTRVMSGLLFGMSAADPATFLGVALLLGLVVVVASYLPAWRATRVEPLSALRYE